jgi:hypothetical protein
MFMDGHIKLGFKSAVILGEEWGPIIFSEKIEKNSEK